jgi:hypothetical protein
MMKNKLTKVVSLALCSLMFAGLFGGISEAHRRHYEDPPQQDQGHSEGEVITAGIVGAVVGAVIAKNT